MTVLSTSIFAFWVGIMVYIETPRTYSSTTVFLLESSNSAPDLNLPTGSANLARLTGAGGIFTQNAYDDRVLGREFILEIDQEHDLRADPYFNNTLVAPGPLSRALAALIRWINPGAGSALPSEEEVTQKIIGTYRRNVSIDRTDGGATRISVTHEDPDRAAEVANGILDLLARQLKREQRRAAEEELAYYADALSALLGDMNEARNGSGSSRSRIRRRRSKTSLQTPWP